MLHKHAARTRFDTCLRQREGERQGERKEKGVLSHCLAVHLWHVAWRRDLHDFVNIPSTLPHTNPHPTHSTSLPPFMSAPRICVCSVFYFKFTRMKQARNDCLVWIWLRICSFKLGFGFYSSFSSCSCFFVYSMEPWGVYVVN